MTISRLRPDPRRLLAARLSSVAKHHAEHRIGYRPPTPQEKEAAVADLRAISTDPELLAMQAGIALGAHNPERADWVIYEMMADFLITAGADQAQVPYWIEEGRRRAARRPGLANGTAASTGPVCHDRSYGRGK